MLCPKCGTREVNTNWQPPEGIDPAGTSYYCSWCKAVEYLFPKFKLPKKGVTLR